MTDSDYENRPSALAWNLVPVASAVGAAAARFHVDPPLFPLAARLASHGLDFGLAAVFAFSFGYHIRLIRRFGGRFRASSVAAVGVGVFATLTEVSGAFPGSTFDPIDIVAYWAGVSHALLGLRLLPHGLA